MCSFHDSSDSCDGSYGSVYNALGTRAKYWVKTNTDGVFDLYSDPSHENKIANDTLRLIDNTIYEFDLSDVSNNGYEFRLSNTSGVSVGWFYSGNIYSSPRIYTYQSFHLGIIQQINIDILIQLLQYLLFHHTTPQLLIGLYVLGMLHIRVAQK